MCASFPPPPRPTWGHLFRPKSVPSVFFGLLPAPRSGEDGRMPQTRSAMSPAPQDRLLKTRRGEFVLALDPLATPASSSVVPTKQTSQSVSLVRIGLD